MASQQSPLFFAFTVLWVQVRNLRGEKVQNAIFGNFEYEPDPILLAS